MSGASGGVYRTRPEPPSAMLFGCRRTPLLGLGEELHPQRIWKCPLEPFELTELTARLCNPAQDLRGIQVYRRRKWPRAKRPARIKAHGDECIT